MSIRVLLSVLCCGCLVFLPHLVSILVCFLSLLSVIIRSFLSRCVCQLSMIILCSYSPVCSVWFCPVYSSLLPSVPALPCLALPCLIKDCLFELHPRLCFSIPLVCAPWHLIKNIFNKHFEMLGQSTQIWFALKKRTRRKLSSLLSLETFCSQCNTKWVILKFDLACCEIHADHWLSSSVAIFKPESPLLAKQNFTTKLFQLSLEYRINKWTKMFFFPLVI